MRSIFFSKTSGGKFAASEVRRLQERVRELERLLGPKTMEVEILKEALDLARAKNRSCCRPRRFWEIPGEDGQRDTGCGRLECRRAPGQQEAAAWPPRATRRCRACWRNPALCRRASDLRVPEDRRAPQARAAIRGSDIIGCLRPDRTVIDTAVIEEEPCHQLCHHPTRLVGQHSPRRDRLIDPRWGGKPNRSSWRTRL